MVLDSGMHDEQLIRLDDYFSRAPIKKFENND